MFGGSPTCASEMGEVRGGFPPAQVAQSHCVCVENVTYCDLLCSGAFLLPYTLVLFTCGIPLFFLEVSLGQMTGQGGITCWKKICPLFEGPSR